jgi:hypothetical protein
MNGKNVRALGAAMVLGLCAAASTVWADPPPWAPAHGERAKHQYRYVYYPQQEIYYSPESRLWFWASGNRWQFGVNLPVQYEQVIIGAGGVGIVLRSDRPYTEHVYVVQQYGGRPHGHRHHDHDDDDDQGYDHDRHGHDHGRGHGHDGD